MSHTRNDMEPRVQFYTNYYQHGGAIPVFHGYEQYGGGIGNFLGRLARGVWDFIRPAAISAGTSAISTAAQGIAEGKSLKDTARSALGASVGSAIRGVGEEAQRRVQSGGRRRKRKGARSKRKVGRKATHRKTKSGRVYKRRRKGTKAFSNF